MKKYVAMILALVMLMNVIPAMAQTVANGPYQVNIPADAELYTDAPQEGEVAYYICDGFEFGLYQYDAEGLDLNAYVENWGKENNAEQTGIVNLNGIEAGYYLFAERDENGEYYMMIYAVVEDDVSYEFAFAVDKDDNMADNSAKTAAIMETIVRE